MPVSPLALEDLRPWPDDWRWTFLHSLARSGSVSEACAACGKSRDTAYRNRAKFTRFREKWDEAIGLSVEVLEVEARKRALNGPADKASHIVLMFLLRAHKPATYRNYPPALAALESDIEAIDPRVAAAALKAVRESLEQPQSDPNSEVDPRDAPGDARPPA